MAIGKRSSYTDEKRQAVLATVRMKGVCAAAKEYGIPQSCVSRWATAAGVTRGGNAPAATKVLVPTPTQSEARRISNYRSGKCDPHV
jgi:transposase-like protein